MPETVNPSFHEIEEVLYDLDKALEQYTRLSETGHRYVLTRRFKTQWLTLDRIEKLLKYAFPRQRAPPEHAELVKADFAVVLSILFRLDQSYGALLVAFTAAGERARDDDLPIPRSELASIMRTWHDRSEKEGFTQDLDLDRFVSAFDDVQYEYVAHIFKLRHGRVLNEKRILPIRTLEPINDVEKGGTANVYQITVLEDFVGQSLQEELPNASFELDGDEVYQFALKVFRPDNKNYWSTEVKAFKGLAGPTGSSKSSMVDYLGSIECLTTQLKASAPRKERAYMILLELGEKDLEDFMFDFDPPGLEDEIHKFWTGIFDILSALEQIHTSQNAQKEKYIGAHCDIKPDNILFFDNKPKLADPGLAFFMRETERKIGFQTRQHTTKFGAPDMYESSAIDIWSFGCVLSVIATWMIWGWTGVVRYEYLRRDSQRPDRFHNGTEVLTDVVNWHKALKHACRKHDYITPQVIDLIDDYMLLRDPSERISAPKLFKLSRRLWVDEEPSKKLDTGFQATLIRINNEVRSRDSTTPSNRHPLTIVPTSVREDRKKQYRQACKQVAQRSDSNKSILEEMASDNARALLSHDNQVSPTPEIGLAGLLRSDKGPENQRKRQRESGASSTMTRPTFKFEPSEPEDATERVEPPHPTLEIHKARKKLHKSPFAHMPFMDRFFMDKDAYLKKRIDDRDFVFIVDNSYSMQVWWEYAEYVLTTLVAKCLAFDDDGIDVRVTIGKEALENCRKESDVQRLAESIGVNIEAGDVSNPCVVLDATFKKHIARLRALQEENRTALKPRKTKYLTVIMLTDGRWAGLDADPDTFEDSPSKGREIRRHIIDHVREAESIFTNPPGVRGLTVQFIQFGSEHAESRLLNWLDDYEDEEPDVIDCEHATGCAYKMVLGSFNRDWDAVGNSRASPARPIA